MSITDAIDAITPASWMQGDVFRALKGSIALVIDAMIERQRQGIIARMPTYGTPTALPLIGADRVMPRGPGETDAIYAERLRRAFSSYRRAGLPAILLTQLRAFVQAGYSAVAYVVNGSSQWLTLGADYSERYDPTPSWDWDGDTSPWHTWVILAPSADGTTAWQQSTVTWGDGTKWGDSSWNWGLTGMGDAFVASLKRLARQWMSAHASLEGIIVALDATTYQPGGTLPDGTQGHWHKLSAGVAVPARASTARYIGGIRT